mmetsp:Transcript_8573/g.17443  ORF Transcript_8573/g.17443 Transcript_8573/m.17443 type:complete len:578 (-) Transcript_8573:57-1790(-)
MEAIQDTTKDAGCTNGNNRKRGERPHRPSKENRKRARGGGRVGGAGAETEIEVEILPLTTAKDDGDRDYSRNTIVKRIRVVRPYPFTFSTFAKARWKDQCIIDVYHKEFGSYPRSYYESAINEGRILVSGSRVSCDYKIKGGDELSHTVHRHEPAVAVNDGTLPSSSRADETDDMTPLIRVLHEDDRVIVVDKPATMPNHPCGGYNFNSLFHILASQDPSLKGRLHTIHRLDRQTSGLSIIAKNRDVAKQLGQCIRDRENCQKMYIARVKGKFPLQAPSDKHLSWTNGESLCQYGETNNGEAVIGYWITDCNGAIRQKATLDDVFGSKRTIDGLLSELETKHLDENSGKASLWLHLSCPCRIASHKNGVCEAGEFSDLSEDEAKKVKPAQTSFAVVEYDKASDSTVILVKPETGRMHQIRLHCQYLHHPIANDSSYGGELWYDDPTGERACLEARNQMDEMDRKQVIIDTAGNTDSSTSCADRPDGATSTNVPATEAEIVDAASKSRDKGESLLDFIKKTCVWCARSRGGDRTTLEFLVRSRGIWLHALQYSFAIADGADKKVLRYKTDCPSWAIID